MRHDTSINYYAFSDLHRRDRFYHLRADHSQCVFTDIDQFFPFTRSPSETLHYLTWMLESYGSSRNDKFHVASKQLILVSQYCF